MLHIKDLCAGYDSGDVLHSVTFDLPLGENLCILGPNGCGKTTLLKSIAGLLESRGELTLDGRPIRSMRRPEIASHMAVMSQMSAIYFSFSVYETVMMGRYSRKDALDSEKEEDTRIVYQALKDTGTLKFADRDIDELSGGERRRVMIARALVQEPDILLLDEPTLHLDINHQFDLMDLITKLSREKSMLVVIVTHDLVLAARYCDRVIAIEHGEIAAMGRTRDVLTTDNMRRIFDIEAEVNEDPRVGLNVTILGKSKTDPEDCRYRIAS